MGLHLIAETAGFDIAWLINLIIVIFEVAIALGMVIFVHELGHFAVAKWCGVKCEKFYLGFDIGGLKLWKKQWGETEYGIGVLPLGGYVKMLGQDDNPSKAAEEMQRAKVKSDGGGEEAGEPVYDPRSYLAKSVPQRMAIISAGVVMNVIFAFVVAMIAYGMGVEYTPCNVASLVPGQPAWKADLRPNDKIIQVGNVEQPRFQDLRIELALEKKGRGAPLLIERPGVDEPFWVTIYPDRESGLAPTIGILAANTNVLHDPPVVEHTPAAQADPEFQAGDKIVAVNDIPVQNSADLEKALGKFPNDELQVRVERPGSGKAEPQELLITVGRNPMRDLGLVMQMGAITVVQANSPAAEAGLQEGDFIAKIDGQSPGDPMTLPERLRQRAGETVTLTIDRPGRDAPLEIAVTLREPIGYDWPTPAVSEGLPMTVPALGVGYEVLARVTDVKPGSPAAAQGLKPGDEFVAGQFLRPAGATIMGQELEPESRQLEFTKEKPNWPVFFYLMQEELPGTKVELTLKRDGGEERVVTLEPVESDEWFNPARGFRPGPLLATRQAGSLGEAFTLGLRETKESLLQVYRFLDRVGSGQLSPKLFGGPVSIATAAGYSAAKGLPELLLFLTMLSANLAVINFLPIPLLDGGHMLLLIWEGIRGKPASERVTIALHYAGFCFILSLMLFVITLDVSRILNLEWVMQR